MQVDVQALAAERPNASDVGWFAARQPGVVRYLEERLLVGDGDAYGVALEGAWQLAVSFRARFGVPPRRIARSLLERAEKAVLREARHPGRYADGCAQRQPDLCRWLLGFVQSPPVPLTAAEAADVGTLLAAVIYAMDEQMTGRPVP